MATELHIIQPARPATNGFTPLDSASPPWDLVCLHAHLRARSAARVAVADFRLPSTPGPADWAASLPREAVVLIRAGSHDLAHACALLRACERYAPSCARVLWGPLPSAHPTESAALPGVQFVFAGDPEPLARTFLASRDVAARLRNQPGILPAGTSGAAAWLPSLDSLTAPTWDDPLWRMYVPRGGGGWNPLVRLTRGHTGLPADRSCDGADEPLRIWPFTQLALALGRTAHLGGTETLLVDPPGIWTPDRLGAWCRALVGIRNSHPWGFRTLPRSFSETESALLSEAGCRRVEVLFPACDAARLATYGVPPDHREWRRAVESLSRHGRSVSVRVWLGGPRAPRRETSKALRLIAQLGFPAAQFRPHPFAFDAPLTREAAPDGTTSLSAWMAQATRDAASDNALVDAWGGRAGLHATLAACRAAETGLKRSLRLRIRRAWQDWRKRGLVDRIEDAVVKQFRRGPQIDP